MKFNVHVSDQTWSDADRIFEWIAARSQQGAIQWDRAFFDALDRLQSSADQHGAALESTNLGKQVRECFFKTRRGLTYRLIYEIIDRDVYVLRVRGPGQRPIRSDEINE